MSKESLQKEGPDIEYTKMCGFSDEQIEAIQGMGSMLPRGTIWRLRKRTPKEIIAKIKGKYGPAIKADTANFTEALNDKELHPNAVEDYKKLIRNSIKKDIQIANELNDPELLRQANKELEIFSSIEKNRDKLTEMELDDISRSSAPPTQPLDSSI